MNHLYIHWDAMPYPNSTFAIVKRDGKDTHFQNITMSTVKRLINFWLTHADLVDYIHPELTGWSMSISWCGVNLLDPCTEEERNLDHLAEDEATMPAASVDELNAVLYDDIAEARRAYRFGTQL
jgi:hypothetical protein